MPHESFSGKDDSPAIRMAAPHDVNTIHQFIRDLTEYEHGQDQVWVTPEILKAQMESEHPPFECLMIQTEGSGDPVDAVSGCRRTCLVPHIFRNSIGCFVRPRAPLCQSPADLLQLAVEDCTSRPRSTIAVVLLHVHDLLAIARILRGTTAPLDAVAEGSPRSVEEAHRATPFTGRPSLPEQPVRYAPATTGPGDAANPLLRYT